MDEWRRCRCDQKLKRQLKKKKDCKIIKISLWSDKLGAFFCRGHFPLLFFVSFLSKLTGSEVHITGGVLDQRVRSLTPSLAGSERAPATEGGGALWDGGIGVGGAGRGRWRW